MSLKLVIELEEPSAPLLTVLVEGLARADQLLMHDDDPPVTAFRYQRERGGVERWQTVDQLLRSGRGDCEDLAAYHTAWLRRRGINAHPVVYQTGPRTLHVVVWRDGQVDDPSRWGGMR